jgi:hypothetical protein
VTAHNLSEANTRTGDEMKAPSSEGGHYRGSGRSMLPTKIFGRPNFAVDGNFAECEDDRACGS